MNTKGRFVLTLTGIFLALASGASGAGGNEGTIKAYAPPEFFELVQDLGNRFMKENSVVSVKVFRSSSELGFQALMTRKGDLVMTTRKPNIVERGHAERKRLDLKRVRVGWENVAVITNPDVRVSELTVEQLRKVYTGEYKNWLELGGADLPISLHSLRYPEDETAVWFADRVLGKAVFYSSMIWVNRLDFLVRHVSVHSGSVAYLSNLQLIGILERHPRFRVQVIGISASAGSRAVRPAAELSKKGDYPLTIPLFLFWAENNPDKRVEQFARFCTDRIQDVAQQSRR